MAEFGPQWVVAIIVGPISIAVILILAHRAKSPDDFARLPTYMFFGLSVFALCLIAAFAFFPEHIDVEAFTIGMMRGYNGTQWVINVGGLNQANSNGMQVPVYVIVLGVLGAYVRYLYIGIQEFKEKFREDFRGYGRITDKIYAAIVANQRTIDSLDQLIPTLRSQNLKNQFESQKNVYLELRERKQRRLNRIAYNLNIDVTSHILNTVGLFLLGPLLAVMAWLILLVSNATNQWIFALVALTVGFTASSIIGRATSVAGERLSAERARVAVEAKTRTAASVALSATRGSPGTVITLTGEGFSPQSGISVNFNDEDLQTDPEEINTNSKGKFSAKFTVPQLDFGEYELAVEDDEGNTANVTFSLTR